MASIHIINPVDRNWARHRFILWVGEVKPSYLMIWANDLDTALEHLTEWCDDNAPGYLTSFTESDYRAAWQELRHKWEIEPSKAWRLDHSWESLWPACDSDTWWLIVEHAEQDHSTIGHTTLKHGTHIANGIWGIVFMDPSRETIKTFQAELEGRP